MATRSVTNMYTLMRTKFIQNRGLYSFQASKYNDFDSDTDECINDKAALMEISRAIDLRSQEIYSPPWTGLHKDAQDSITWLKNQLEELYSLQHALVLRPNLDDLQKKRIQDLTLHITRVFASTKKTIDQIILHSGGLSGNKESQLSFNVSSALISKLKNVFNEFQNIQKIYDNKMKRLESKSLQTPSETEDKLLNSDLQCINDNGSSANDSGQQLQMLHSNRTGNAKKAVRWKGEVNRIASSIIELSNIFKDAAHMAIQRDSVSDRIDYNIEQTMIEVDLGAAKLIESEKCDRMSDLNMKCLLILVPIIFLLLFFWI